ncbi:MAG: hypothetical protein AAGJ73_15460 [Pseudomonadota bacterium]
MLSLTATLGLASLSALLIFISGILRQLGASEVAKGLMIVTGVAIVSAFAITYLPGLLLP